ncbi:putrescine-ornithine antiporter (plasmid) [Advenella sp. S44]|uniref:putrescine-ornithine antiporter n=1 Tax=Advenella sp. S44 TaxID=1982755 RepID=UPI000C2A2502|nr:putrescine-ornithine antiporter [Advenella sp. S44]PJX19956.1 putrescine-ornithine antiporter [Advenella sp. S44]
MKQSNHKMGVVQLTILTVVNMMGSGIVLLPTKLAQIGTISIFSWLITASGSVALAYAFAKCGRFSKNTGGMGGYAEYSFGKSGNFMANYTYAVSLVIANVAIAITAVGYFSTFMGWQLGPFDAAFLAIIFIWLTTIPNFWGARITGRVGSVTVWGVILPVLGISLIGWFWFDPDIYTASWNPHNEPFGQAISASIAITLWAFLGLESACANTDAVENPEKNVPIAVLFGTLLTAVLYILSTNVVAGIIPNADLANSNAPFGLVFSYLFSPVIGQVINALTVIACLGSLLGWQFTVAQVFKAGADEGYYVPLFGKVTSRNAPVIGMVVLAIAQTMLSLMTVSPDLSTQFNSIVNLAVVTNLVPYILSMSAIIVLLKSAQVPQKQVLFVAAIAFIGNIYSFYALYSSGQEAMFWGGLVTFAGWVLYGKIVSTKYDLRQPY